MTTYVVLAAAALREGCELTSPLVRGGPLAAGEVLEALDEKVNSNGQRRVLCSRGWLSAEARDGVRILDPVVPLEGSSNGFFSPRQQTHGIAPTESYEAAESPPGRRQPLDCHISRVDLRQPHATSPAPPPPPPPHQGFGPLEPLEPPTVGSATGPVDTAGSAFDMSDSDSSSSSSGSSGGGGGAAAATRSSRASAAGVAGDVVPGVPFDLPASGSTSPDSSRRCVVWESILGCRVLLFVRRC